MQVRPVAITQSLIQKDGNGPFLSTEEHLVYVARVSNPGNQNNTETSDRLVAYLLRNKHISPFEQVDMTFEIKTSRAIAAQILRHWSARFQEFSQRYAEVVDIEPIEIRMAPGEGQTRQGSGDQFDPELELYSYFAGCTSDTLKASEAIESYLTQGQDLYKALLKANVAKEVARMILPLATQTTMYMKGDLRSWIFYLAQRVDKHAQKEHRVLARWIREFIAQYFPMVTMGLLRAKIWEEDDYLCLDESSPRGFTVFCDGPDDLKPQVVFTTAG